MPTNNTENVAAREARRRALLAERTGERVRTDPLDENEVALLIRLKQITDTKKLQARLPAWIKKHQKSVQPPKQFEFIDGAPPVYPAHVKACFTRQSDTGLDRQYPNANGGSGMSTAQYIAAYYAENPYAAGAQSC